MNTQQSSYNILVIGKTGVGKSSFVNYLMGKNIAESGTGRPVTERGSLHQYDYELDGFPVTLYDSWGLEANKYKEWKEDFSKELNERGVEKPASEWFHSVFYCISGGGHRVEDVDIDIVQSLIQARYPVSVILTKCDMLSQEQKAAMVKSIYDAIDNIRVIPMSSGGKNRSGIIEPFGLEEIKKQAKEDFFISMAERIPVHLRGMLYERLKDFEEKINNEINEIMPFQSDEEIYNKMKNIYDKGIKEIFNDLSTDLKQTLNAYARSMELMSININGMSKRTFQDNEMSTMEYIGAAILTILAISFLPSFIIRSISNDTRKKMRTYFNEALSQDKIKLYDWLNNVEWELTRARDRNISQSRLARLRQ